MSRFFSIVFVVKLSNLTMFLSVKRAVSNLKKSSILGGNHI